MANYSELLNDINAAIYENNDQEIDALEVRAILREMVASLGSGFLFKGIATPSSPSGTGTYEPDQNVFYLATTAGTYTYLGGLVVAAGEVAFLCFDGTWTKKSSALLSTGSIVDNTTTEDATKPLSAKQGKVLADAGAATAAEVAALGQEMRYQSVTGNGNTYVSKDIYGLVPGHSYRLYLHNKDYDKSGVTISSGQAWFSGVNVKTDNTQTSLFGSFAPDTPKAYYDFVLPTDTKFIRVGGRATSGTKIEFTLEDMTEVKPIADEVALLDLRVTSYFLGDANTFVKSAFYNLVPGHQYRVYPKATTWDTTGVTSTNSNLFAVLSYYNNVETTLKATLVSAGATAEYYDFIVPANSDYIVIGGRAAVGEKIYFEIVDNTHIFSLASYVKFNSFRYFNDYVLNERQEGADWPDIGKIISPPIPAVAGDKIELSASSNIAPFTNTGTISGPTTGTSMTISGATIVGVYVSIVDTDGFWIKKNGETILVWSSELKEQILVAKRANSLDSAYKQEGLEIIETKTFNGSIGNPGNANLVHTPSIHAGAGASVVCYPNVPLQPGLRYVFGFTTRTSAGTAKRDQAVYANYAAWQNQRVILNEGEEYIGFYFGIADTSNNWVPIRKDAYPNVLLYVSKTIAKRPYIENATQLIFPGGSSAGSVSHPLALLHFSDIHGSLASYSRIEDFSRYVAPFIDDVICTGDSVQNAYTDPFTYWTNAKFLNVIGNHDTASYSGGTYDWTAYAGLQAYMKFFAPFISNWGVTQPANAATNGYCYYYKDYAAKGIRLIVIDVMKWDATQLAWLEATLADAITNSLAVVIASHYPAATSLVTPLTSNWMSFLGWSGSDAIDSGAIAAVDDFISDGGEFICWIAGHTHRDQVGYLAGHNNQLCIVVDTCTTDVNSLNWVDANRVIGEPTQDLFNMIAFDATEHQVRIVRVGCATNKQLQTKNTIVISYDATGANAPTILRES